MQKDGSIQVKASGEPTAVKLWQASNPKTRDFRIETIGRVWKGTDLQPAKKGEWLARVAKPEAGWTAYLRRVDLPREREEPIEIHDGSASYSGHLTVSEVCTESQSSAVSQ